MSDIQQLIEHAESLIKHTNCNLNFTKLSVTPSHLMYDIRRIANRYELTGDISFRDIEYLEHIYNATPEYLQQHVYMLGEWHEWQSRKHRNYSLKRKIRSTNIPNYTEI